VDAVSLKDILGDPLIAECWEFNYLHNLDFLMDAFDEDVRNLVKVHVIHGFWKNEDPSRLHLKVIFLTGDVLGSISDSFIARRKRRSIKT
jgi:tyrosyl-DNA phosphodiesterase-1